MREVAVISDVHAQLDPLSRVLQETEGLDVWCLGDFAAGGPDALLCYDLVLARCSLVLAGNHELFVAGRIWQHDQHRQAAYARWAELAYRQLGEARTAGLQEMTARVDGPGLQLVHASLRDPLWEWIADPQTAEAQRELMQAPYLLFGHTHQAALWDLSGSARLTTPEKDRWIDLPERALLNPGAVGGRRGGQWMLLELDEQDLPQRACWRQLER